MTCRQKLSPVKSYKVGGVTYPRPSGAIAGTRHVSDTHLELAELLRDNLDNWLKGVIPMSTPGLRKIYAEEITDQAFDAIQDIALEVDETYEEDY